MDKKSKIIVSITIIILLIIMIIIGYNSGEEDTKNNEIPKIDKVDIQIDDSKLNIFYFYVGEADCTLIMNKGQIMLIDAGEESDGTLIVQFLRKIGIPQIDYLIGTHSDNDHIGGMSAIIKNFPIGEFYMPSKEAESGIYHHLIETAEQAKIKVSALEINDVRNLWRCYLEC